MTTARPMLRGTALLFFALAACGGSTSSGGDGGTVGGGGTPSGGSGGTPSGGSGGAPVGGSGGSTGGGDAGSCGPAAKACAEPSQCVLAPTSCCLCGMSELSDFVAVNQDHVAECACGGPICECATMLNPNLGATCSAGSCAGLDVRTVDSLSLCQDDADCALRVGIECCPGCTSSGYDLVAIRVDAEAALQGLVCDSTPSACDACMPVFPPSAKATCGGGRCQVATQ